MYPNCVVFMAGIDFYYMRQRPQQLAIELAKREIPCYFINSPSFYNWPPGLHQITPFLYVAANMDLTKNLAPYRPVLYISNPCAIADVQAYNPSLVIFDSLDAPLEAFAAWEDCYPQAVNEADLVTTSSLELLRLAENYTDAAYLIPNGCDYEHFARAARNEFPVPLDIAHLPRPLIGFIGALGSWIDYELIQQTAEAFPQVTLILVGPIFDTNMSLHSPNVFILGHRDYSQLPAYLQEFSLAIIPFLVTPMTQAINPIKVWEYLAAGLSVVATELPELQAIPPVRTCPNDNAFIASISDLLNRPAAKKEIAERQQYARQNSWQVRVDRLLELIDQQIGADGKSVPILTGKRLAGELRTRVSSPGTAWTEYLSHDRREYD